MKREKMWKKAMIAIFSIEEILKEVVLGENIQAYYKVQDSAQARLKDFKSGLNSMVE